MTPKSIDETLTRSEREAPFRIADHAEALPDGPTRTLTVWDGTEWREYDPRTRKRIDAGAVELPPAVAGAYLAGEPVIDEEICA